MSGTKSYGTSSPNTSFGDTVTASDFNATKMTLTYTDVDQFKKIAMAATPLPLSPRRKRATTDETEENEKLSKLELQRLVLPEQLQTTRVQSKYYERKIKMDAVQIVHEYGRTYVNM